MRESMLIEDRVDGWVIRRIDNNLEMKLLPWTFGERPEVQAKLGPMQQHDPWAVYEMVPAKMVAMILDAEPSQPRNEGSGE